MTRSLAFIDDTTLTSGSRDTTLRLWKLNHLESRPEIRAVESLLLNKIIYIVPHTEERRDHTAKVRDLAYSPSAKQLFTLGGDGYLKIFDAANFEVKDSVPLRYTNETVCLEDSDHHLFAVGSQNHMYVLSRRQRMSMNLP